MAWSLRQVIGYWMWWRRHRLTAQDRCQAALDFPEYLQWVRQDLERKQEKIEKNLKLMPGH